MKKLIFTGFFILLGVFAFAQNLPSVRVVNSTGYSIYYIHISPANNDYWGSDILGEEEILENGQTLIFDLTQTLDLVNVYDILLIDEEYRTYSKMGITMTNNARIVFTIDDLEDTVE